MLGHRLCCTAARPAYTLSSDGAVVVTPSPEPAAPARTPTSWPRVATFGAAFVVLGQQTAWHLGDLAMAIGLREGWRACAAQAGVLAALLLGLAVVGFSWWRRRPAAVERRRLLVAAAAALILGFIVLQALVVALLPVAPFYGFCTWRVSQVTEVAASRPRVTYARNSLGFRGAEWAPRATGTTRVVLIGDSYVFGSGVEAPDTLDRALAARLAEVAPARRFEVLNLGIPGDNIASHVRLYEIAAAHLEADAAILCLTLPNDLSRVEPPRSSRPSCDRASRGSRCTSSAPPGCGSSSTSPRSTDRSRRQGSRGSIRKLGEIRDIQRAHPRTSVFLFPFRTPDPPVAAVLSRSGAATVIPTVPEQDDARNFIPGDGHPNAEGNRLFARRIAAFLVPPDAP